MNAPHASDLPHPSPSPGVLRPSAGEFDAVLTRGAFMPLDQFGVIEAAGDDAANFLHGQLTNDIQHLDAASARLAGYCSPKGRLIGSMPAWRAASPIARVVSDGTTTA